MSHSSPTEVTDPEKLSIQAFQIVEDQIFWLKYQTEMLALAASAVTSNLEEDGFTVVEDYAALNFPAFASKLIAERTSEFHRRYLEIQQAAKGDKDAAKKVLEEFQAHNNFSFSEIQRVAGEDVST